MKEVSDEMTAAHEADRANKKAKKAKKQKVVEDNTNEEDSEN